MDDLIRRSDALNELSRWAITADRPRTWMNAMDKTKEIVRRIPAVDAVEVVHGEWLKLDMHMGMENYKCSVCRSECYVPEAMGEPMYPLCPNCGARMDGRREEDA